MRETIDLVFVLDGNDVPVEATMSMTLKEARSVALSSRPDLRGDVPPDDWKVIGKGKRVMPLDMPIAELAMAPGVRLRLSAPRMTLIFIINGVDVPVKATGSMKMVQVFAKALRESGNMGRPISDWVVRDEKGVSLPHHECVARFNFPEAVRLFLMPAVGAGGRRGFTMPRSPALPARVCWGAAAARAGGQEPPA